MENLIDLIFQEFIAAGYQRIDDVLWRHSMNTDFWIVVEIEGEYDLSKLQPEMYERLSEFRAREPEMEKNTSMLIINRVEGQNKNVERVIADENDVYVFKKYILQYTLDDWNALKQQVDLNNPLNELLMTPEVLDNVKKNQACPISLLYQIAHKLPFVTINVRKKKFIIEDTVMVPNEMQSLLDWVNTINDWEGRNPDERDIQTVKSEVERVILQGIEDSHEDREDTLA